MKTSQAITDKLAIGLSIACTLHCLALPIILALLPSIASLQLDNEAFHLWMLVAVLPSSLYALTLGCKQHKRYQLFILGTIGLALLILALLLEDYIGEPGEKILTVLGTSFVALGHWLNFRLCRVEQGRVEQNHVEQPKSCCPKDTHSVAKQ